MANQLPLIVILLALVTPAVFAQDDGFIETDLPPLRRVVFYNSGVAHMQHRGEVADKARLEIRFSSHDVDDVLKSLVFEDQGGGHVRAVEYQPAPNPEDVAANSFEPMTLAQLLQKYRGESVKVFFDNTPNGSSRSGQIFGLENRQYGDVTEEVLVLIDEAGSMRSVILNEIDRVVFQNEEVRDEMKLAMTGITKSRKANQKRLDLLFDGKGKRKIAFGYVVDAPIWRMSYRLEVKPEQIELQGWTHINNVTGVDWQDVVVELRSGQPQTFHAELFAPVLSERRSIGLDPFGLPKELTLVHQWYGFEPAKRFGDTSSNYKDGMTGGMGGGFGGGGGFFGGPAGGGGGETEARRGLDGSSAFKKLAQLDRTASMIRFQLDDPVSLKSGKSAALPVFEKQLPSRLLSVAKHTKAAEDLTAIRSIELTNATDFSLVPGPISVSRDGDFVGDAQIPRLAIGAATQLPYAVDRAVLVSRRQTPVRKTAKSVSARGKEVVTSFENRFQVQFTVDNQDKDARLMVVEYQLPSKVAEQDTSDDPFGESSTKDSADIDFKIEPAPAKNENGKLTYEVTAAALAETKLNIQVRWTEKTTAPLRKVVPAQALAWLRSDLDINAATKSKLQELVALTDAVSKQERLLRELTAQRAEFTVEQTRIRENLRAVGASTAAAEPYLKRMGEMEKAILDVIDKITSTKKQAEELKAQRDAL